MDARSEKRQDWLQKMENVPDITNAADLLTKEQDVTIAIQYLRKRLSGKSAA